MTNSRFRALLASIALVCMGSIPVSEVYSAESSVIGSDPSAASGKEFFSQKNVLIGVVLGIGGYYLWNWYQRSKRPSRGAQIPDRTTEIASQPAQQASEWCNPQGVPTEAVFGPALFQSPMTAAYYAGEHEVRSTKEVFVTEDPFRTMQPGHVTSCNFCEIVPMQDNRIPLDPSARLAGLSLAFSNVLGIRDLFYQNIMGVTCNNENQQQSVSRHGIDFSQLNIGQEEDIQKLSEAYDCACKKSESDIVMYGFSRGSATTFNFLSTAYRDKKIKRVKAAVLGGCFDSIKALVAIKTAKTTATPVALGVHSLPDSLFSGGDLPADFMRGLAWLGTMHVGATALYKLVINSFPKLGPDRKDPIDLAEQFPHNVPLLLVASKVDGIVPYQCTVNLYNKLKSTGHDKVYLLTLEHAGHGGHLFKNNAHDRERYLHTVHAFYKQCGVSYIPEFAEQGASILAECKA